LNATLLVQNISIRIIENDFISLTDLAKYKNPTKPDDIVKSWIKALKTIDFLEAWEQDSNLNFNPEPLVGFKNSGSLNPKQWIEKTNAIGIISQAGRYGGTYAHRDIAFEFASWLEPKFKLFVIKDYQRLKKLEFEKLNRSQLIQDKIDTSSFSNEKLLDVQKTLLGLETAIRVLKVSEASKLLMTETIYRELGIKTNFLPKYSDEKHTYSLTHLLKKFGSKLSAQKVNQKLLEIGILEIKTRKSRQIKKETNQMLLELEFNNIDENIKSETIREFKSLTEKGLKFGKNLINPKQELQTQPHYFESSFAELLNLI
jgi:hypothetical protein